MNEVIRKFLDNICVVLIVAGCCCGIVSFFVDWVSMAVESTTGYGFIIGESHEIWSGYIGRHIFIPLNVFILTIISICALLFYTYRINRRHAATIVITICGILLLLHMMHWSTTDFTFEGKNIYFADYVGTGTVLGWCASWMIMVGGGMCLASEGTEVDNEQ